MNRKQVNTVIVIGAGIVGLSSALAMRLRGHHVTVLDAAPLDAAQTERFYALNQASIDLLSHLSVWHPLSDTQAAYRNMHVWDAQNGAHLDFNAQTVARRELGFIVKHDALKQQLNQQCLRNGVIFHPNTCAQHITQHDDTLMITHNDSTWRADLLIVTDGAHSPTREQLQVPITCWAYHQHAITATVTTEKPHQHTAYQVFHPDGPLAFLPLTCPHQCSIVWSTSPEKTDALMRLNDHDFADALTQAFAAKLGYTTPLSTRQSFPLHMRHAHQYAGARWLLMGDAAHTIHPLAGLGLNLGFDDLRAWLQLMDHSPYPMHHARVLSAYQRQRKHHVWQTIAMMEGLKQLFSTSTRPLSTLRSLGLRLINQTPTLKRWLIEQASGSH